MKLALKLEFVLLLVMGALLLLPAMVSAHERQAFEIGGEQYLFIVGSLGEPLVVDDKSGTDLRVYKADPNDVGNSSADGAEPVEGLEDSLKVIMSADGESREMDLSTVYGQVGAYKTLFFPTKSTQLTYTIVGELNGVEIELPFTCQFGDHVMSAGHNHGQETEVVSEDVSRIFQSGSFTCPQEKAPLGFPLESASVAETQGLLTSLVSMLQQLLQRLI